MLFSLAHTRARTCLGSREFAFNEKIPGTLASEAACPDNGDKQGILYGSAIDRGGGGGEAAASTRVVTAKRYSGAVKRSRAGKTQSRESRDDFSYARNAID